MYCTECGKKDLESSNFCGYCGNRMKSIEYAGERPVSEPLPVGPPVPHVSSADHSDRLVTAPGGFTSNGAARWFLAFALPLMCVFPVIVVKRSVDFYKAAAPTAPDSSLLSVLDELAGTRGNRDVASRWTGFDRSISRWATSTLVLDLAIAVCAAWIGYNLFTRRPLAVARAKTFMLAIAVWALVRDVLLPKVFDLQVAGNKLSMFLFLVAALAGFVFLKRIEFSVKEN